MESTKRAREDDESFRLFAVEATPVLYRAASLLVSDRAAAEDLVQTTFLRVARRWPVARKAPFAYAKRVIANLARDYLRRSARRPTRPLEHRGNQADCDRAEIVDFTARVAERLEVVQAIRELPPEQRAVVVFRYYLDLSVAETAKQLAIAEGTVKSASSRALAALERSLAPGVEPDEHPLEVSHDHRT